VPLPWHAGQRYKQLVELGFDTIRQSDTVHSHRLPDRYEILLGLGG